VAVHPDCWCICLCYLHFAPENPEDGEMYLLVPAHPGCPDKVQRAVKWLCVCCVCVVFRFSILCILFEVNLCILCIWCFFAFVVFCFFGNSQEIGQD